LQNIFVKKSHTCIAIILLILGAGIYFTFRQDVLFLVPFRETKLLEFVRLNIYFHNGNILTYFLIFVLPDVLWYSALLLLQLQFYNESTVSKILFYVAVLLPFIFEILQYFKIIAGTCDIFDVIFYSVTFIFILFIWKRKKILLLCKSL